MKKILIGTIIILLCILAYFAIFRGITIGNFKILSVTQIKDENDYLTQQITETEALMKVDYLSKTETLNQSMESLLEEKNRYLDLASVSTESELEKASQEETYKIEYLWTKIGRHAAAEGVNIRMDVLTGDTADAELKNINFTVTGSYIAISNFVSSIENDSELGFRIEDFKLIPGASEVDLQATFVTRNVRVKTENISNPSTTTGNETNTNTDTDTNTGSSVQNGSATRNETDNTLDSSTTTNNAVENNTAE